MQSSVMWACLFLGLVVAATASDTASESAAHNATSRALPASDELVQTVERLLSAVLGSPESGSAGRAWPPVSLLAALPLKLGALKAALVAAAPGIAIAGLVIAIIALAKVGALYKKLGLSAFDTIHEALPKFGLPGQGFPEDDEYDGYGRYDPTEYAYHDDGYSGESSYAGYASRHSQAAEQSGGGRPAAQVRFVDQSTESKLARRTPSAAPLPLAWS